MRCKVERGRSLSAAAKRAGEIGRVSEDIAVLKEVDVRGGVDFYEDAALLRSVSSLVWEFRLVWNNYCMGLLSAVL